MSVIVLVVDVVGTVTVVVDADLVVVVIVADVVQKKKKLGKLGIAYDDNPQTRKAKVDTTSRHVSARSEVVCVSGGTEPPPGRMRWGARGGAENISSGTRDQPRAPPTMHLLSPENEKPKETRCRYDKWRQTRVCHHPK